MSIRNRYEPAYPRLEEFLMSIGRRKFIKPLYEEVANLMAQTVSLQFRRGPDYRSISVASINEVLKWKS